MTENLDTDSQMNNQIPPESQDFLKEQLPNDIANTSVAIPVNQEMGNEPTAKLESLTNPDPIQSVPTIPAQAVDGKYQDNQVLQQAPVYQQPAIQDTPKEQHNLVYILIIIILILVIVVMSVLAYGMINSRSSSNNSNALITSTPTATVTTNATSTNTATPTSTSSTTPKPTITGESFENEYMKVIVPSGWTKTTPITGAVNLMKNNYILYINPYFQQASGVEGGRFSDISSGAPSSDAVLKSQPANPCGTYSTATIKTLKEYDYYVSNTETNANCNKPASGTVWYFSYVTKDSGYINYYVSDQTHGYVITMSYNSRDITKLPKKDDATLVSTMSEMQEIIKTLELKKS